MPLKKFILIKNFHTILILKDLYTNIEIKITSKMCPNFSVTNSNFKSHLRYFCREYCICKKRLKEEKTPSARFCLMCRCFVTSGASKADKTMQRAHP